MHNNACLNTALVQQTNDHYYESYLSHKMSE